MTTYKQFISDKTIRYLQNRFPSQAATWLSEFDTGVDALCAKWSLTLTGHEKESRFGTILYANSGEYGPVAVKIVPRFSSRLQTEIACYRALPYREMCPLYDTNAQLGAMLLKYIPNAAAGVFRAEDAPDMLFQSLYDQRLPADSSHAAVAPIYENVLTDVTNIALCEVNGRLDTSLSPLRRSISRARETIRDFAASPRYLIHGDAHQYNIITGSDGFTLIDPLGYIAPFEFEFARFLGTATRDAKMTANDLFSLTAQILPREVSRPAAMKAYAIDVTLRACNTFIEGNAIDEIRHSVMWAERAWTDADTIIHA